MEEMGDATGEDANCEEDADGEVDQKESISQESAGHSEEP